MIVSSQASPDPAASAGRSASPARAWMRALEATAGVAENPKRTLPVVISDLGRKFGEKPALLSERETLSFAALAKRMNQYSRWAISEGVAPGATICLLMPNRPEYLAIWLGIAQVGGVVALLNTNLTGAALAHCFAVAAPSHIIVAGGLAQAFATAAPHLAAAPKVWLHGEGDLSATRIDHAVAALEASELAGSERRDVRHADRALCIYTSGTTGLPKAANVSHHRIMMWSYWFAALADIGADDRMYDCLPLYHSVGGIVATGAALVAGASVVVQERFSARQFWSDVARWDCTLFQYIGELCRYLNAAPTHPGERTHRLRLACGNGMSADVWSAFEKRFSIPRILEFYAATEGNFSLYNVEGKIGAIGKVPGFLMARNPIALVKFDFENDRPLRGADGFCVRCAREEPGEAIGRIAQDGRDLSARFEGYTNSADTEKKILRNVFAPGDAYMRSGDLMRLDAQGFYYFVDRLGDTFRWKGENVATLEVASVLAACPESPMRPSTASRFPEWRAAPAWRCWAPATHSILRQLRAACAPFRIRAARFPARPARDRNDRDVQAQKHDIAKEGFDPGRIADPLFVFDRARDAYVALDAARFAAIASGAMRL